MAEQELIDRLESFRKSGVTYMPAVDGKRLWLEVLEMGLSAKRFKMEGGRTGLAFTVGGRQWKLREKYRDPSHYKLTRRRRKGEPRTDIEGPHPVSAMSRQEFQSRQGREASAFESSFSWSPSILPEYLQ